MLATDNIVDINNYQDYKAKVKRTLSDDKKQKILEEIVKNKGRWYSFFGNNLQRFRNDKQFYIGEQWDNVSYWNYFQSGKQPFTFNLLKPIVKQLAGEVASMAPSLTLGVVNVQNADPNLVRLMTDFTRAEMYHAKAAEAYNQCFINMCIGGWGVLKVGTEYINEYSFDQRVCVYGDADPLYVGFDPSAEHKTKCDSNFQFCDYFVDKEEFRAMYDREPPPAGSVLGTNQAYMINIDADLVIITEYYKKDYKSKTLVQLTNYENYKIEVLQEDVERAHESYIQMMREQGIDDALIPPLVISNKRKTKIPTITCYKCVKDDVLEWYEWPSKMMPYVFVDCSSTVRDGRQITESFIFNARDAQQNYNYILSEIYNGIPKARREQVWLTKQQAAGQEWLKYPDRLQSHAEYNFDINVPNGPIFRPPEELPQTLFNALQTAKQAIYDAMGVMPVGGSELPNNLAAVTVGRIITQGNLAFVRVINNLFDAMQQVGEIFLDLVPKIYDAERIVSTVDASGAAKTQMINTIENNQDKNAITDFLYTIHVEPVASFAIQQQELREDLLKLAELNPNFSALMGDLIASTYQTPIAPQLVERLKTALPPAVVAQENGQPPPPPAPPSPQEQLIAAQAQKAQADAQLSQAKAQAEQFNAIHKGASMENDVQERALKAQIEIEKLKAAQAKIVADQQTTMISANAEIQKAQLDKEAKITAALANLQKQTRDNNT